MSAKRLQVHLDEDDKSALDALVEQTGLTESNVVRASLRLAEEVGLDGDGYLLKPLASPDWPWPDWWGPLCKKLEEMREVGEPVTTPTGIKNLIVHVDPHGGTITLESERSRSGAPRTLTVSMLRDPENATAHGVIVRVLRSLPVDIPPVTSGWFGPFKVLDLLGAAIEDGHDWPPERLGVYLVSRKRWRGNPKGKCEPLYVGSTTGRSARFCTRVGDLIIDMFGFYGDSTGHSSGGQSLWAWCHDHGVQPGDLYLGWYTAPDICPRCEETRWYETLAPSLNKISPPRCLQHTRPSVSP